MASTGRPVALVTGASSGIGKAAAVALVAAGFQVIGTSRNAAKVDHLDGVTFLDLDVSDDRSAADVVQEVVDRFGRIDVLVNNAGVGLTAAAEETSVSQARHIFDVNVLGVIRMTNAVLPHMRARGSGRVINVSSIVGLVPQPFMAVYGASKHAIEGYSESMDHELREHGVRVLLIEPAWTRTAFDANSMSPDLPLAVYAARRQAFEKYAEASIEAGDDPVVIAKKIVAAATDSRPRLRYTASVTGRVRMMRRLVPTRLFDKQLRKLNKLPA